MNGFDGLNEYSFVDLAKAKMKSIVSVTKTGAGKVKNFFENNEDSVEIVVKSVIIIAGICVAIKDAISDKKLKEAVNSESKSRSRVFCFLVDVFNVIKRVL